MKLKPGRTMDMGVSVWESMVKAASWIAAAFFSILLWVSAQAARAITRVRVMRIRCISGCMKNGLMVNGKW
jgi:hypothetical protein